MIDTMMDLQRQMARLGGEDVMYDCLRNITISMGCMAPVDVLIRVCSNILNWHRKMDCRCEAVAQ